MTRRSRSRRDRRAALGVIVVLSALLLGATSLTVLAGEPQAGRSTDGRVPAALAAACAAMPHQFAVAPGVLGCSHGPDPAPPGIDLAAPPTIAQLAARASAAAASAPGELGTAVGDGVVPCIGDGSSGRRLEAIYAHREGEVSRYDDIAPLIRTWAAAADGVFDASAATTGGIRHLRWLHDAACQPIVHEVALSDAAVDDFDSTVAELYFGGFDRFDRRYVVWVDANVYCGVAMTLLDESAAQSNASNGVEAAGLGLVARIDLPCWGIPAPNTLIEAHEIGHTLGAVQPHAPHSSSTLAPNGSVAFFYGHCIDEFDTMCYADGTPKSLSFSCSSVYERLLDCNHDDYFSTNPAAGSYLATHWNTASNAFLVTVDPVGGFLDLAGSPFKTEIAWLATSGITRGCAQDQERFCPMADVTRGQMAAFLVRGLALPPTAADFFTDDEASIFEGDINRLAAANITRGCATATTFCPDATITRGQMAAFLGRALALPATSADFFTDDEASIFEGDINRLAAAGLTGGCGGGRYCPDGLVSREQMAAFLYRALH